MSSNKGLRSKSSLGYWSKLRSENDDVMDESSQFQSMDSLQSDEKNLSTSNESSYYPLIKAFNNEMASIALRLLPQTMSTTTEPLFNITNLQPRAKERRKGNKETTRIIRKAKENWIDKTY